MDAGFKVAVELLRQDERYRVDERITTRRSEPGTLAEELAEQLQEVLAEREELVNVERVQNRPTDALSGGGSGCDAPAEVGGTMAGRGSRLATGCSRAGAGGPGDARLRMRRPTGHPQPC
ncbi:hypothetical protein TUSST3_40400 [Streptomyces sp. TUS-ST3]|uniref:hypothetical protein n=1 Tax=Streptomyces sp. TUS-ST3 TaxID=3025591 RepID=UPI00235B4DFC|nr:hypothetical protein [Streptomyces sp. TUS-ST3]GLP67418.1 hypothetical protein TUSST3_40400 [Streptomyces sp. TUS-ST3]